MKLKEKLVQTNMWTIKNVWMPLHASLSEKQLDCLGNQVFIFPTAVHSTYMLA
jgi:hypothetical protein